MTLWKRLAILLLATVTALTTFVGWRYAQKHQPTVPRETPSARTSSLARPEPPRPPQRVKHPGVGVDLESGDPRKPWLMRETSPLVEPDLEPRPITILFHGICNEPTWTCDWFQYSNLGPQWQLCPRGPVACGGNNYRWDGDVRETRRMVEAAVAKVKERHGARVRDDSIVLAGFSNGAYGLAALVHHLAQTHDSKLHIRGLVFFGADVTVSAADVRALGARVGFTAGDQDGSSHSMRAQAAALARQGIETRYVSLGKKIGHFIPVDSATPIAELIDWTREGDANVR
jgi:predicted esterase